MPKINVYLPDDLAEAVRTTGVPVSAICQRALEQSVRRVTAIRATVLGDLETDDPTAGLSQFTERTRAVVALAVRRAREARAADVGTEHLLHGLLAEGTNLALHVLRAMEVDPAHVARALADASPEPGAPDTPSATRFSGPAANAVELTVTEALALGHNYVGCEHLLLGIVAEPNGAGGETLRELGVEIKGARRAVQTALAGLFHLQKQQKAAPDAAKVLEMIMTRLARLEQHAGIG